MCCTPDSAYWRHVLDCVGREWLLIINHPHYFGSRSVQTSDELGHHLNVGHDQAGVMMQSKRRCHCPLAAHVFKPILWRSAEESCRLWRPHILHHMGVMEVDSIGRVQVDPAIVVIVGCLSCCRACVNSRFASFLINSKSCWNHFMWLKIPGGQESRK